MNKPVCLQCKSELNNQLDENGLVTCPGCGKKWQLTANDREIANVVVTVNGSNHGTRSKFPGGSNG